MKDGRFSSLEEFENDPVAALIDANNTKLAGISFALVMEHEGNLSIHYRSQQPCYGECRKYFASHKDYTDPYPHDEYRPGDLFDPFPVGKPVAVSFGWASRRYEIDKILPYLNRLFNVNSPWISGFGSINSVEFTTNDKYLTGVIIKDTHVDPTVMINFIQNLKNLIVDDRIDQFGDDDDLFFLSYAGFSFSPSYSNKREFHVNSAFRTCYYNPASIDIPRFLGQNPHRLSGGTGYFDEGSDYNRKIIHELFEHSRTVFQNGNWLKQSRKNVENLVGLYMKKNPAKQKTLFDKNLLKDVVEELREMQTIANAISTGKENGD